MKRLRFARRCCAALYLKPMRGIHLVNIFVHVTAACNGCCTYCYASAGRALPRELSRAELRRIWLEAMEYGVEKVIVTGGEPLARPDIMSILEDLKLCTEGSSLGRCLNTNGMLVTANLATRIASLVDEVRLSIDGLEKQNDAVRGIGAFRGAVCAFKHFRAAGIVPKILVTVCDQKADALDSLLRFLIDLGATKVHINRLRPAGRAVSAWNGIPLSCALEKAAVRVLGNQSRADPPHERPQAVNCGVGSFMNVWADGEVYPCHVLTAPCFRCGNIRDDGIKAICTSGSLLARLHEVDFKRLAQLDPMLAPLAVPGACLGEVWRITQGLPVWDSRILSAG